MADQGEHYEKSWILHHILDGLIGSREIVDICRKRTLIRNYVNSDGGCQTGSGSEGFRMEGSDLDTMLIGREVEVMCSNQDTTIPSDNRDKTILVMRKDACRPCYVTIELVKLGRRCDDFIMQSFVSVRDRTFASSEIIAKLVQEKLYEQFRMNLETHGPASSLKTECSNAVCDFDYVLSYSCAGWPPEANEWLSRPRQHGWPNEALICDISQSGCHVVPVGDKTSADTFLQWRMSFTTAETKLISSLSHEQFLVYGLLKLFLKQISEMLKNILGDVDILSSYIMKTAIFFAVESTPQSLWKEQNTFYCFRLCLKILIIWVNAGYCPNYFIINNNMFQGKLHGGNQETLLRFLLEMHNKKWQCLSVGTFIQPSIGVRIQRVMDGHWEEILVSSKELERERDRTIFSVAFTITCDDYVRPLALLSKSQSDMDECIAYLLTVKAQNFEAMMKFGLQQTVRGNKQKYKFLRECKYLFAPFASACTSPGLLTLATFFYQTGNYMKALMACWSMLSSFKVFFDRHSKRNVEQYEHLYCGHRYTLLHKCREAIVSCVKLFKKASSFCPSELHEEITDCCLWLIIPPLPYAMFLSFLCYHELGDSRRRDTALHQLRAVKNDEQQGRSVFWIVNNLLGICYELIGDTPRAIREYKESLSGGKHDQQFNPARKKIARLQHSHGESF